ncbi:MAG: carbohydrate ABC transporter permease [Firmicutes bacterium]|nr:carbohydrate ABC transporter permease [Bacillota bacterium]
MEATRINLFHSNKAREIAKNVITYLLLCVGAFVFLVPFFWMVTSALKTQQQMFRYPIEWIPDPVMWENFPNVWTTVPFAMFLKNSIMVTSLVMVGDLFASTLVAYGFARKEFFGKNVLFLLLLGTMMIPQQVTMIPLFILYRSLGWIDTFRPLIVPSYLGNAFFIFMMRQFFLTIPVELEEAAILDGCGSFRVFTSVFLPLSKPALVTVAIFSFMNTWNDFFQPLIYLNSLEKKTLALGLAMFKGEYATEWGLLMAASVQVVLPCLILFFSCQKYFVEGIALTGIKG